MSRRQALLVIRHEPFEHLGYFEQVLQQEGVPFDYSDMGSDASLDAYSGLILMGGPQSANDPNPALADEMQLIRDAVREQKPVLGICLGSQLIAKALGARVFRNAQKEIGWSAVHLTEEGARDPLFSGIPNSSVFFHWHGETFDLPEGAVWLAYSDGCRHQAFRYSSNVYGIQFHPEITPEMIIDWFAQPLNCGDTDSLVEPVLPHAFETSNLARRMIEGWLDLAHEVTACCAFLIMSP